MDTCFRQVAEGDSEVFARLFLSISFLDEEDMSGLFYGTDIRARHSANYLRTFERLSRLAKNCDVDGIIEDSLRQNAFGLLYVRIRKLRPEANAES